MTLVMTLMVRDEADLIASFLDHHVAQGVDQFIVTDNGSRDGTTEILREYAERVPMDLRYDPVHRKQQSTVVTRMARDAYRLYGADWVINADADEMWTTVDPGLTLREAFRRMPSSIRSFTVPVIDMTGPAAALGSGLQRLLYRDLRSPSELAMAGLRAHSTPDAVHVGDADVRVGQGNHIVTIASEGSPPDELALEVLHFPWRSWDQYRRKVENAGRAYLASPDLTPSPNHHGMIDYRRLLDGTLFGHYLLRHPDNEELVRGVADGTFVEHRRIADSIPSSVPDEGIDEDLERTSRALARSLVIVEMTALGEHERLGELEARVAASDDTVARLTAENKALKAEIAGLTQSLHAYQDRRLIRLVDALPRRSRADDPDSPGTDTHATGVHR